MDQAQSKPERLRLVIDVERHFVYPGYVSPSHSWRFEDSLAYTDLYEMIYEIAMLVVVIREKLKGLHLRLPYFHSMEEPLEKEIMGSDNDSHQRGEVWEALERRSLSGLSSDRLPSCHDLIWRERTSMYREFALLERSES